MDIEKLKKDVKEQTKVVRMKKRDLDESGEVMRESYNESVKKLKKDTQALVRAEKPKKKRVKK